MQLSWHKLGDLECIIKAGRKGGPAIILFHGYGADANDLYPLHSYLDLSSDINWIFPQGPLQTLIAPGYTGRSWFNINIQELERAMAKGQFRVMSETRPPGLDHAFELAMKFYQECQRQYSGIAIGGFSQGAMLATELVLKAEEKPMALIVLSGTLLDKDNWESLAPSCAGVPFFQSHGINDALLDPSMASDLEGVFIRAGMKGELIEFNGGHEIPQNVLAALSKFLKQNGF